MHEQSSIDLISNNLNDDNNNISENNMSSTDNNNNQTLNVVAKDAYTNSSTIENSRREKLFENISNEFINLNDINKYTNLGLSLPSQELIGDFYHTLVGEDHHRAKSFEEVMYAVVEDIQQFKKETERLEQTIKMEKEKNEQVLKHMIEEADNQLAQSIEAVNQERKRERDLFEKSIEKLKEDFHAEIFHLHEIIDMMRKNEEKLEHDKNLETQKIVELNDEIKNLLKENDELKTHLNEADSLVSSLKNKIVVLEQEFLNEDALKKDTYQESNKEINLLRNEIIALSEANKKLVDKNDALYEEIEQLKLKSTSTETIQRSNSNYLEENQQVEQLNDKQLHQSIESDDDIDSAFDSRKESCASTNDKKRDSSVVTDSDDEPRDETNSKRNQLKSKEKRTKICDSKSDENVIVEIDRPIAPEKVFRLLLLGDSTVGKTSFIMRYCKNKFLTTLSSTLGVDFHMKMLDIDGKSIALQLWDTCGQERFRSIARSYFRKADGVVLMYDCTYERSFLNIREWMLIINENGLNSNSTGTGDSTIDKRIPIILVGNKTDLRDACRQANKRVIEHEDGLKLAKEYGALFVETSAKMGTNMDDSLMAELSKSMICKQELESDLDYLESKLNGANCQFEATSTRQVDKLSEKVKSLSDENRELKTLFQECQIKSDLLERQLKEIMSKKRRESSDAESNQENINKASDSKATNSEPKALHNAYKKLNDINDLLRDEIENIKMKASRIAEREPLRHLSSSEKQ